jgi:hypothetical protein
LRTQPKAKAIVEGGEAFFHAGTAIYAARYKKGRE